MNTHQKGHIANKIISEFLEEIHIYTCLSQSSESRGGSEPILAYFGAYLHIVILYQHFLNKVIFMHA